MKREESFYPEDWLGIAEKDLRRAEHMLAVDDAEAAGFFLQQTVEKSLKAFLLSKGWQLERTHDLEALLNAALPHDETLEEYRSACQRITGFYFVERYPLLTESGITGEDVRGALEQVRPMIGELRGLLKG